MDKIDKVFKSQAGSKFSSTPSNISLPANKCVGINLDIGEIIKLSKEAQNILQIKGDRKEELNYFKNIISKFKKSKKYNHLKQGQIKLIQSLSELKDKLFKKYNVPKNYFKLNFLEKSDIDESIFTKYRKKKGPKSNLIPDYQITKEFKEFTKEMSKINKIEEQLVLIQNHLIQIQDQFKLYCNFIKNATEKEFKEYKMYKKCLNEKL